ncbi:MAG: hypothetical protein ACI88H_002189 [Cocleimonas sp.]|jgi:hypothetical protein
MPFLEHEVISCNIDHLSFGITGFTQHEQNIITTNIQDIANTISEIENLPFRQVLYPKKGYGLSIKLPLFTSISHTSSNSETPHLFIQLAPKQLNRSFFRCEIKGHPISVEQWLCARLWLELLLSKDLYLKRIPMARANKIDIAADFLADIEEFLFDHARAQAGGIFFDRNGKIKTMYIGSMTSKYKVCIYCRRTKHEQIRKPVFSNSITRVEVRLKLTDTSLFAIGDSIEFGSPFSNFTIYDFKQMNDSQIINEDFIDLCRAWGIKTVLQRRTQSERRKIRKELQIFEILMVDDELLLKHARQDIKNILMLNADFNMNQPKVKSVIHQFKTCYQSKS